MRRAAFVLLTVAAASLSVDCGGGSVTYSCTPECPPGSRCSEGGCVITPAAPPDLASALDAGAPCAGGCPPAAPHCRDDRCVPCLDDSQCPTGQSCRPLGAATVCVAGCSDDVHCGGGSMRCCQGACTDVDVDDRNCGACAASCSSPHALPSCQAGSCVPSTCQAGWGDCNLDPADGCEVNLQLDPLHCTACKQACTFTHARAACSSGCYIAACNYGWQDCNSDSTDGCEVDITGDLHNCGGCGAQCGSVPRARVACVNSACVIDPCADGFADCDQLYANGCEVSSQTDPRNCGVCGKVCAQGLVCLNGGCTCKNCNLPNARSACVNQVCSVAACLKGFLDCDGQPGNGCESNILLDAGNCGGCGVKCGGNTPFCQGGVCSPVGQSCYGILMSNRNAPDGPYIVDPDGNGPVPAKQVYCDMTTDGGGWTIVWSTDAADNEVGLVSDSEVVGNGLLFEYSNLTRAAKMALSAVSHESLFKRKLDGAWLKADAPLFDGSLDTPNSHIHVHVNLKSSDGVTATGAMGYANYNIAGGGDYGVSMIPDGPTCRGNTVDGFDHHATTYFHLNCDCDRMYLYSYSNSVADNDDSYNINTGLGAWTVTAHCTSLEGGGVVLFAAMR